MAIWSLNSPPVRSCGFVGTMRRFVRDERGAVAIEYAMIAAGIGAAIASTVFILGETVSTMLFDEVVAGVNGS